WYEAIAQAHRIATIVSGLLDPVSLAPLMPHQVQAITWGVGRELGELAGSRGGRVFTEVISDRLLSVIEGRSSQTSLATMALKIGGDWDIDPPAEIRGAALGVLNPDGSVQLFARPDAHELLP